jgi:thiol-disulfide isomerase/thioredoxin
MRKYLFPGFFLALILSLLSSCVTTNTAYNRIPPGIWRGVLELEKFYIPVHKKDTVIMLSEQFKEGDLPFNFEVKYTDEEHFYIELINGSERIKCDSIVYGRDKMNARDTFNVYFKEYQTYIHTEVRGGVMKGEWVVPTKENYRIPFYAYSGKDYRFTTLNQKPTGDLTGTWAASFGIENPKQDKAVGEFKQKGNHLEGTFRTESGDYRYLEGTVQGRRFWMSCFDGSHAFLFSGSIHGDTLDGEFKSGKHLHTLWKAWRDPHFDLTNADSITTVKSPDSRISFDLNTPEGKNLKFPSQAFDGKIKIFTISGTWCPNCRDEQVFLRDYLKNNPEAAKDLSIVSFSFERHKDPSAANTQLMTYKKALNLPYDVVYAGKASADEASRFFPALSQVTAFPTMMILDKHDRIRKVHTGFDGPATSRYSAYQAQFSELIEGLRKEK